MSTEIIYKFLPPEINSYLENQLLRFTQPGDLNDPFECIPAMPSIEETKTLIESVFSLRKQEINTTRKITKAQRKELLLATEIAKKKQITALTKEPENMRTIFFQKGKQNINSKIGVLSLSNRWDSTLMWSHYCQSHKGFCIGFDKLSPFFTSSKLGGSSPLALTPVIYSDSRVKVPLNQQEVIDINVMFTKSLDWQYEEEERLLALFTLADKEIKLKPFDIYLFEVPHQIIKEVIIGANSSKELQEEVIKFAKKINVPLYKSIVSETAFDMSRIPL